MATYAPLSEDFTTGSDGATVGAGYGIFDGASGTGTSVLTSDAVDYNGHRGVTVTTSSTSRILRADFTDGAMDNGWIRFGVTRVSGGQATVAMFYAGDNNTLAGSVRIGASGAVEVRDSGSVTRWSSSNLADGTVYEVSVKPTPNAWQVKVYAGSTLLGQSGVLSTGFSVSNLDTLRFGSTTSSTAVVRLYWLRADTTTEPAGSTSGSPVISYTRGARTVLDARASVGAATLVQTSGATATPAESPTGVFTITHPDPFTAELRYTLTLTDGSASATETITVTPGAASTSKVVYRPNEALTAWV